MKVFGAWLPVAVYMSILYVLSAQPDLPSLPLIDVGDKLKHFAVYLGLALFAFRGALLSPIAGWTRPYLQSFCMTALYGASDEYHQSFVQGRSADVLDWLADILGAALGLAIMGVLRARLDNGGERHGGI